MQRQKKAAEADKRREERKAELRRNCSTVTAMSDVRSSKSGLSMTASCASSKPADEAGTPQSRAPSGEASPEGACGFCNQCSGEELGMLVQERRG